MAIGSSTGSGSIESVLPGDRAHVEILEGAKVDTIADVIARMREIDEALPAHDGLKWFNRLYLMVTEEIDRDLAAARWADGVWLERLDVLFGRIYFDAIVKWLRAPDRAPSAWAALFAERLRPGVAGVQYGVAGMNAHINRDLPVAVVQTCLELRVAPRRGSAQHVDYTRVNEILEAIEVRAMRLLATGVIGDVARRLGRTHDALVMWPVRKARAAAWLNAEFLWRLRHRETLTDDYVRLLDRVAGFAGRKLLIPTESKTAPRQLFPREPVASLAPAPARELRRAA